MFRSRTERHSRYLSLGDVVYVVLVELTYVFCLSFTLIGLPIDELSYWWYPKPLTIYPFCCREEKNASRSHFDFIHVSTNLISYILHDAFREVHVLSYHTVDCFCTVILQIHISNCVYFILTSISSKSLAPNCMSQCQVMH